MKYKIAFICVHNSCRSQMAEAITRLFASDIFEPYSAGTEVAESINQEAVATIRELYGIDMNATQRPKDVSELPDVDIVVTMGCGVTCPTLYAPYHTDWGLEDPTGKSHDEYIKCARTIENKVMELKADMLDLGEELDNISNVD
ncbi:MAG: arsenate reductase ArsC [Actinobacteria bacterium]|nr:arsenate reductase ArsC [Actinomycetota bacterium]